MSVGRSKISCGVRWGVIPLIQPGNSGFATSRFYFPDEEHVWAGISVRLPIDGLSETDQSVNCLMARTTRGKEGLIRAEDGSCFLDLLAALVRSLLNRRLKILLFAAACVLAGCLTVFVVESGYFSTVLNHDRDIRGQDRMFLDELMQKRNQQSVLDTDPMEFHVIP